jgi:hypothetical protein
MLKNKPFFEKPDLPDLSSQIIVMVKSNAARTAESLLF